MHFYFDLVDFSCFCSKPLIDLISNTKLKNLVKVNEKKKAMENKQTIKSS